MLDLYHAILIKYQGEIKKNIDLNALVDEIRGLLYPNIIDVLLEDLADPFESKFNDSVLVIFLKLNKKNELIFSTNKGDSYTSVAECLAGFCFSTKINTSSYTKNEFEKQLASLEYYWNIERESAISEINVYFNKNFKKYNGIYDIYDKETGAIFFYDYEWTLLNNSPLKQLFDEKEETFDKYILQKDDKVILRGCWIYYYFPCEKKRLCNPTKEEVITWFERCTDFLQKSKKIVRNFNIQSDGDKRLVLGYLDNLRNIVILSLNTNLHKDVSSSEFTYKLNVTLAGDVEESVSILEEIHDLLISLCLTDVHLLEQIGEQLDKITYRILCLFNKTIIRLLNTNNENQFGRSLRLHRELDDFWEIYTSIKFSCQEIKKRHVFEKNKTINLVCLLYGGIELPLLARLFLSDFFSEVNIIFYYQKGTYLERNNIQNPIVTAGVNVFEKESINLILDDNIMTGNSVQRVLNYFALSQMNFYGLVLVRHPNLNRFAQMEAYKNVVDFKKVEQFLIGALFPSPYSKIKLGTNYKGEFLDELGVFTLSGDAFLKPLYKNGFFRKNSEVDTIRGLIEGRDR